MVSQERVSERDKIIAEMGWEYKYKTLVHLALLFATIVSKL